MLIFDVENFFYVNGTMYKEPVIKNLLETKTNISNFKTQLNSLFIYEIRWIDDPSETL